jgi:hypothetical protein|tara:strand:- start:1049 stop:1348 length:300 start_codon:yes stop_codon:yes gene_type:complete
MILAQQIEQHNKPLQEAMKAKGFRMKKVGKTVCYYDKADVFQPFPAGYITGPSDNYNTGKYMSVRDNNGCWKQQTMPLNRLSKLQQWALDTAKEVLTQA